MKIDLIIIKNRNVLMLFFSPQFSENKSPYFIFPKFKWFEKKDIIQKQISNHVYSYPQIQ